MRSSRLASACAVIWCCQMGDRSTSRDETKMSIANLSTQDDDIAVCNRMWQGEIPTSTHPGREGKKHVWLFLDLLRQVLSFWQPHPHQRAHSEMRESHRRRQSRGRLLFAMLAVFPRDGESHGAYLPRALDVSKFAAKEPNRPFHHQRVALHKFAITNERTPEISPSGQPPLLSTTQQVSENHTNPGYDTRPLRASWNSERCARKKSSGVHVVTANSYPSSCAPTPKPWGHAGRWCTATIALCCR